MTAHRAGRPARVGAPRAWAPLLVALVAVAPAMPTAAQVTGSVSGRVLDAETGAPVANAIVEIPARSRAVLSAEDGSFALTEIPQGTHVLRVRQFGYADRVRTVDVDGPDVAIELRLTPDAVELEGLDVAVDGAVTLGGRVIDGGTGMTMPGVYVWLPSQERGVMSDSSGTFRFDQVPTGPQVVQAERAGYGRRLIPVVLSPPVDPVDVIMVPDSVALAGIPIIDQRLRGRRNASTGIIFALDTDRLTRLPADDVRRVVQNYTLAQVVPCTSVLGVMDRPAMSHWCIQARGGRVVEPVVCIDGEVRWGGLDELQRYRPHELYLLEVSGMPGRIGQSIRAYTHQYIATLARRDAAVLFDEPDLGSGDVAQLGWSTREGGVAPPSSFPDITTFRC